MNATPEIEQPDRRKHTLGVVLLVILAIIVTALAWTGISLKDFLARF